MSANSLVFDGSGDYVDFGADASIDDLHQNPFTVDVYIYIPVQAELANNTEYVVVGQEDADPGWVLKVQTFTLPTTQIRIEFKAGTVVRNVSTSVTIGGWVYIRGRKNSSNRIKVSANAGTEGDSYGAGGNAATGSVYAGQRSGGTDYFKGKICYLQLWSADKGVLAYVPTSPISVDADTELRVTFSEGSGDTVGDDSGNGNHGTRYNATWSTTVPSGWSLGAAVVVPQVNHQCRQRRV